MKVICNTKDFDSVMVVSQAERARLIEAAHIILGMVDATDVTAAQPEPTPEPWATITIRKDVRGKFTPDKAPTAREQRACKHCKAMYIPRRKDQLFCCEKCGQKSYRQAHAKPVDKIPCKQCGKMFKPFRKDSICCCPKCRDAYYRANVRKPSAKAAAAKPAKPVTVTIPAQPRATRADRLAAIRAAYERTSDPVSKINDIAARLKQEEG
jgi:predicted  nucleic acid-binding Zn-ribbon protein